MFMSTIDVPIVSRTMDAARLNAVANNAAVRPWLGGEGILDFSALLTLPTTIALQTEHGGFICLARGEGRYEVHSLFGPARSQRETVRAMRASLQYMFTQTDCLELVTKVPQMNRAALGLARLAHFQPVFTGTVDWSTSERWLTDFYHLTLDRWAATSDAMLTAGREAHERMADAYRTFNTPVPAHSEDDDSHLRFSGAAWTMLQAGQARKAVDFYNRYAVWSGYPPIRLVREQPTVIDLDGLIVEIRGQEVEVLGCR